MKNYMSNKTGSIRLSILTLVIVLLLGTILTASAIPLTPNMFYGSVTLNGEPAPVGTSISAYIDGICKGSTEVETAGTYGGNIYLSVNGENDKIITFTVNEVEADETIIWVTNVGPREVELTAAGTSTGDSTNPEISITSPSSDETFSTAQITVSGTASDNVGVTSVDVKLGSGSWEQASGANPWSASVTLDPGPNKIYARAKDTSGLTNETSVTVNYVKTTDDDSRPEISINSPSTDEAFSTSDITITGTASDNSGIANVKVKVGSGDWKQASGTESWSSSITLEPGPNNISAMAVDTSGNTNETFITLVYNKPRNNVGSEGISSTSTSSETEEIDTESSPEGTEIEPTVVETEGTETSVEEEHTTENETPGFGILFTVAGLIIIIGYLVKRR
jgi:hypothetical protein